jgi:molecular chaperone DnaK (HSP70)
MNGTKFTSSFLKFVFNLPGNLGEHVIPLITAESRWLSSTLNEKKNILVFDLGGGTYDVSILQLEKNKFNVLSINGDTHLGGDDFDNKLVEYCMKLFKEETGIDISNNQKALAKLKIECKKYKEELSIENKVEVDIDSLAESTDFSTKILRKDFENVCKDLFEKLIPPIKEALNDANLKKEDINEIILAGGSSRIPKIQEMLSEFFNNKKLNKTVNPDEIVAEGAAIQASILKEKGDLKIININPISFSIDTHLNEIKGCMIEKNKKREFMIQFFGKSNVLKIDDFEKLNLEKLKF